ncbi:hypothetical protein Krad_2480 [Kineococcus radiotolerans SRS30216 = ATCC BAA-149]|uniref:Uncharacterized protein n=1 Tax=Kineococcus radiotolerans (strain ATCC BAA-149 / DSM 14245 / SRS30216) TaxID=266940 RepID=A6WAW7_KINRD|nr:hypothetical protein Krad_2480 [Kineococcus radiotolerans SRS30216 = ATCC BAA-149]
MRCRMGSDGVVGAGVVGGGEVNPVSEGDDSCEVVAHPGGVAVDQGAHQQRASTRQPSRRDALGRSSCRVETIQLCQEVLQPCR